MGKRAKVEQSRQDADLEDSKNRQFLIGVVAEAILDLCGGAPQNEAEHWHGELTTMVLRTIVRDKKECLYLIRTAPALWSRYRRGDCWTIVSVRGMERVITSSREFASKHLLPSIEHACHQEGWENVQVDPRSSFIRVSRMTKVMLEGLSCPHCPAVETPSLQSLWWHLQTTHDVPHHEAVAIARHQSQRCRTALIVYNPAQCSVVGASHCPEKRPDLRDIDDKFSCPPTPFSPLSPSIPDSWLCVRRADGLADLRKHYTATALATLRDSHGALPLHWAAGAGHIDIVRFLLTAVSVDAPQMGRRAYAGRTALHWAARHGHFNMVQYLLLDAHANVEAVTADGTTAVCWAAWQGHDAVVRLLRTVGGADLGTTNQYGCSPLLWAAQGANSTVELMEWLTKYTPWWQRNHSGHGVLHKAAQRGRANVCRWFVERCLLVEQCQLDVVGPDEDGATPSDLAGMEGHEELARYLADVEMTYVKRYSAADRPTWLREPYAPEPRYEWENGAGILRMRSTLSCFVRVQFPACNMSGEDSGEELD